MTKQFLFYVETLTRAAFSPCKQEIFKSDATALLCTRENGEVSFVVVEGMTVLLKDGQKVKITKIEKDFIVCDDGFQHPSIHVSKPFQTWIDGFEARQFV